MPTENRNPCHNVNSHARPANEAIEFVEGIAYIHNPLAAGDRSDGTFDYDVYGQAKPPEASPPSPEFKGWNYLFQGLAVDPAKPLFEHRSRAMHPGVARWMDQEPLGYVDGLNVYNAPVDEPVNPINPLGE